MSTLTADQLLALQVWQTLQGRRWKENLRWAWETGNYDVANVGVASALQQLRNEYGPRWLIAYRPGDKQVGWLKPRHFEVAGANYHWVHGWCIAHEDGTDMIQPYCRTKTEARQLARDLNITLIEDPK